MKKRTKIIIIAVMVLLLGVTGYLNVMLNKSVTQEKDSTTTSSSYFSSYRTTRESTRDQEMLYYDAIIANTSTTAEAVKEAQAARLNLVNLMENELVIEGLIKAKGFEDCVVTISSDNVNAVVKSANLTDPQVAQIVSVIQSQLGASIENIKVIIWFT